MSDLLTNFAANMPRTTLTDLTGALVGHAQQQEAGRVRGNQEILYNQALSTAMMNPTNENIAALYQTAEPLGRFENARNAINDLFGRMPEGAAVEHPDFTAFKAAFDEWEADPLNPDKKMTVIRLSQLPSVDLFESTNNVISGRVEELQQEQNISRYMTAGSAYFEDPTPENKQAWLDAGAVAGLSDQASQAISGMEQAQIESDANEGLAIFGSLAHGAPELALEEINRQIEAQSQSDDPRATQAVQDLNNIKSLIEAGRIQEAMGVLGTGIGASEYGQNAMDNTLALAQDRRAGESHIGALIHRAIETELADEDMRDMVQAVWEDSPVIDLGLGSVLIDMAQVFEDEGLSADQQLTAVRNLRNQYLGETEGWQAINEANGKVRQAALRAMVVAGLAEDGDPRATDEAVGAADLALANSFQRLIDPATVRQTDIDNMRATIGMFAQVEQWAAAVREGAKFSPSQRQTLMQVAGQLTSVYQGIEGRARDFVETYAPRLGETTQDVIGDVVFSPYDEAQQLEEYKNILIGIDPEDADSIRDIDSLNQLEREYGPQFGYLSGAVVPPDDDDWDN